MLEFLQWINNYLFVEELKNYHGKSCFLRFKVSSGYVNFDFHNAKYTRREF